MSGWVLSLVGAAATWEVLRPVGPWPWRRFVAPGREPRRRRPSRSAGRRSSRRERAVDRDSDLTRVVDLLQVALSAGHSVHSALVVVDPVAGRGPVARRVSATVGDVSRGAGLLEALGEGSSDGDPGVRALFVTLAAGVRSGTPVIPALQRLGDSERTRRRRRTQARVRRLPITMLVPLVLLVLPAFVLLTIVPVLLSVARTGLVPAST
ncbi:MAG: type II secretion system F family protein [Microthrixaceae bacterium]